MTESELKAALDALLGATGIDEIFAAIAEHPALLSTSAVLVLPHLTEQQTTSEAREYVTALGTILADCAQHGVEHVRAKMQERLSQQPPVKEDAAESDDARVASSSRQDAAMGFFDEAKRVLSYFHDREGIVSASIHAAVGWVLQSVGSPELQSWEVSIFAFERALVGISKEADPYAWGRIQFSLGSAFIQRVAGDSSENSERAISCYEAALQVFTMDTAPEEWGMAQNNLAFAYQNRARGDREDNIGRSISCASAALQVFSREKAPHAWALIHNCMGSAYRSRLSGNRADHLEQAIRCHESALRIFNPDETPSEWAATKNYLGIAYRARLRGNRGENLERTIACYRDALTIDTRAKDARTWAMIQSNLGNVYCQRLRGDRTENFELAIACCEAALEVRTQAETPHEWAGTKINLGNAYRARLKGDPQDNIERSIVAYQDALRVYTLTTAPHDWATAQNNLGVSYSERLRGDTAENQELAIECYQAALQVRNPSDTPHDWAKTQYNLAAAYLRRLRDDRRENLEHAIASCNAALQVYSIDETPHDWAVTQSNLGVAYASRSHGDHEDNLERAIACHEAALHVFSSIDTQHEWARTQNNLGIAYGKRRRGDESQNRERAIQHYEMALAVCSRAVMPHLQAALQINLGKEYGRRRQGDRSDNLQRAVICLRDATHESELFLPPNARIRACLLEAELLLRRGGEFWHEAAAALQKAQAAYAARRCEALTPEAQREVLAAMSDVGRWSAIIAVAQGEAARGLEQLEASRGILLREALAIDELLMQDLDDASKAEIEEARKRITSFRAEAALPSGPRDARSYTGLVVELRAAQAVLAKAFAEVIRDPGPPAINIADMLASIPMGRTLVVPVATEFGGVIFVVPSGTTHVELRHVVNCPSLTSEVLQERVVAWLDAYTKTMDAYDESKPDYTSLAATAASVLEEVLDWAWREVMGPALARLAELGAPFGEPDHLPELLIMPTGEFAVLPLHAASGNRDGARRAVLDDFVVSYTPSLTISRSQQQEGRKPDYGNLLALVNPTGDLPFSERLEVPILERLFSEQAKAMILVGDRATKSALKQAARGRSYVHLSCHGSYDWRDPWHSGLMLARKEWLSVPEMSSMNLHACRWAILSACETGITDVFRTPEEAVGLPAALLQAGASCVTATLWSVADASTALFVGHAYQEHLANGRSPAQAVRSAALWLRDLPEGDASSLRFGELYDDDAPSRPNMPHHMHHPFRSPLYWAAFTCWGQ